MRRMRQAVLVAVAFASSVLADDKEAREIIERAIKAHGGADALARIQECKRTDSGKQTLATGEVPFVSQVTRSLPDRFRLEINLDRGKVRRTLAVDGDSGWVREGNGPALQLLGPRIKELREEAYVWWLASLTPMLKGGFTFETVPEVKVHGEPAVGIKVVRKGYADTQMHFLKRNGLLVRIARRAPEGGVEMDKEYLYSDFKEISGIAVHQKEILHVNGKKYTEFTISNYTFPGRIDVSEFKKP